MLDDRPDHDLTRGQATVPPAAALPDGARAPLALPARSERLAWLGALVAAVIGHAVVAMALLPTLDRRVGGGGDRFEAIAVEIVPATALGASGAGEVASPVAAAASPLETGSIAASLPPAPSPSRDVPRPDAARAAQPVGDADPKRDVPLPVDARPVPPAVSQPDRVGPTASPPQPGIITAPAAATTQAAAMPKQDVAPREPETATPRALDEPARDERVEDAARDVPTQKANASAMTAPTSQVTSEASAPPGWAQAASASTRAAASPGALRAFGREVARLLQKTPPVKMAGRGRVAVAFIVAVDGGQAEARVAETNGNAQLEDAALSAVRRVSFPAPPAGATKAERSFRQEYRFR